MSNLKLVAIWLIILGVLALFFGQFEYRNEPGNLILVPIGLIAALVWWLVRWIRRR